MSAPGTNAEASAVSRVAEQALRALEQALPPGRLRADAATCALYAADDGPRRCPPLAVVFPRAHAEVAALVRVAHDRRLPLVARGAGSGNVGGALPVPGSVVVSFEWMQRVLEFDPVNRIMVVETGVVTGEIDRLARSQGLFYPPDPGSAPYCRIGGNLAMNAAGPRAVKYGVTRDYVLGLRAVTGDGREIVTGCRTAKGVVGYDLTRLLVGSEGTLALMTEATLRLLPAPERTGTLRVCFSGVPEACAAVVRVMSQPVLPCALEFMDARALEAVRAAGGAPDLPQEARVLLMVEADGDPQEVARALVQLRRALEGAGLLEIRQAQDPQEIAALWTARRALSRAVKSIAPLKINEDVVVPMSRVGELLARIEALAQEYALPIVSFGHAGSGNLHVNIMVDPGRPGELDRAHACLKELFRAVLALQGTLSGEHGIGYEKREFVPMEIPPDTLALMRALKREFDPRGILNPGKLFPEPS